MATFGLQVISFYLLLSVAINVIYGSPLESGNDMDANENNVKFRDVRQAA